MPMRRSPDEGIKPFEVRVGLGGLPALGGMFRSGDPVTIPPHKFHLLVNMRRTPAGMVTRPGLELEFDTGIQECITGLTEDSGLHGGAIMLFPGSLPKAGPPLFNATTFRAIFPDSSLDYSEYAIAVYGPAATVRGDRSPVIAYQNTIAPDVDFLSRPFIFRGEAVQFALVDRSGVDTVALVGINLAERSFDQASDCWRDAGGPGLEAPAGTPCPGIAGGPLPPNATDPPLWPYQHPVGSAGVLVYFDSPFTVTPTLAWRPDASAAVLGAFAPGQVGPIDQILTRQERIDDILTGTPGVGEVLYFVAKRDNAGTTERRLVRWDGAQQTLEYSAIPDDLAVALGDQAYGPYLATGDVDAGPADWAAYRDDTGAWTAIGGVGWLIAGGEDEYHSSRIFLRGLSWGGKAQMLTSGVYGCGLVTEGGYIHAHSYTPGDTEFEALYANPSCVLYDPCEQFEDPYLIDAVVSGTRCYAIWAPSPTFSATRYLSVGDFSDPDFQSLVELSSPAPWFAPGADPDLWLQVAGGRVYAGGYFIDSGESSPHSSERHGVYDVTEAEDGQFILSAGTSGAIEVYRVYATEQDEDSSGSSLDERYSLGALTAVPNDDHGGQGFQPS